MDAQDIAILSGTGIFMILLSIAVLDYEFENRDKKNRAEEDWLLSGFPDRTYSALFGKRRPEEIALRMKIEVTEYYRNCEIAGMKPDLKGLITNYVFGILCFLLGLTLAITVNGAFFPAGAFLMSYLCFHEQNTARRRAREKKEQITAELPRFLDLLRTELNVGIPVETAIYVICERTDTLLSKEFFLALRKMEFGASDWGKAMEDIARKYDVDILSNFVLNIVTAYRKGVSVANAVEREYSEIHKVYLLNIKDGAEKTKSAALLPMFLFQLIPFIAFIGYPLMVTVFQFI